jgi:integrase/recombinase XerD
MLDTTRRIKLVPHHHQEKLASLKNLKYRVIALLMLDCGLRVSEVVTLKVKNFNFLHNSVTVESLKKRGAAPPRLRSIPLSQRLLEALAQYFERYKNRHDPEAYLFPAGKGSSQPHLGRKQVWKRLKKYSDGLVHPHMLRHTFATRVVNSGNDLRVAQKLLGHKSQTTTEIYTHVEETQLRQAIQSIETDSWFIRLRRRLFPPRRIHVMPLEKGMTRFHVGRKMEVQRLAELSSKKVNVLILGPQGIGKSHLLDNYSHGKILRIDDTSYPKKMMASMLLTLFKGDKEAVAKALYGDLDLEKDLEAIITKDSAKRMVELLIQITQPKEYTLLFDDLTNVTRNQVTYLEKLKNHFHVIAAARRMKIEFSSFLTNFERIELPPLSRPETIELISKASAHFLERIEDFEGFKNHIFDSTQGNPLFVLEMIERYEKEPFIAAEHTRDIRHTAAHPEIDMMVPLIVLLSCLMLLRYAGGEFETDGDAFRLIGGIFLILAIFSRNIFKLVKRKFL